MERVEDKVKLEICAGDENCQSDYLHEIPQLKYRAIDCLFGDSGKLTNKQGLEIFA